MITPFIYNTTPSIRFGAGLINDTGDIITQVMQAQISPHYH